MTGRPVPSVASIRTTALAVVASTVAAFAAAAQTGAAATRPGPSAADVGFVQGMIHHHAQALVMTALVPARGGSEAMRLLAERITVSQRDEIRLMQRWLAAREAEIPQPPVTLAQYDAAGHQHHVMMPGMLTGAELHALAAASGPDFDRLFLEGMIRHHGGALTMVADLFGTPGSGQDSWIYAFAADVDADQRAEIRRMQTMLSDLTGGDRR